MQTAVASESRPIKQRMTSHWPESDQLDQCPVACTSQFAALRSHGGYRSRTAKQCKYYFR